MKDLKRLTELILEKVDLTGVMVSYGVDFIYDPSVLEEVQFRCPFHGRDNKPSARLYKATKSCFCWVCRKRWDVVSFIKERENFSYRQALSYIINRYKVDISSIPDTPTIDFKGKEATEKQILIKWLYSNIIDYKGKLPFEKYRALCAAFSMVKLAEAKGIDSMESMYKIEDKIVELRSQE